MADDAAMRCEPAVGLRSETRWFWVEGPHSTGPMLWMHFGGGFWECGGDLGQMTPEHAAAIPLRCLGPVATPAEVDVLRAAHADERRMCLAIQNDLGDEQARVQALSARVMELEAALREIDQKNTVNNQSWGPYADIARAALKGAKP